jgi:peptide deformylase
MNNDYTLYDLVDSDNEILNSEVPDFDFEEPPIDPIELTYSLVHTMVTNKGIGLAANQLGLPYRVFAMQAQPFIVCFNPRIVDMSVNQILLEEGCLTFPNLIVKIKRPESIRVRFAQPNGEIKTEMFTGLSARIFQHELDHLNGIVFVDRATRYHKEQALRQKRKRDKNG